MLEKNAKSMEEKSLSTIMKKIRQILLIVCMMSGLFACHNTSHTQDQLVIEMEMDEGYSLDNPIC